MTSRRHPVNSRVRTSLGAPCSFSFASKNANRASALSIEARGYIGLLPGCPPNELGRYEAGAANHGDGERRGNDAAVGCYGIGGEHARRQRRQPAARESNGASIYGPSGVTVRTNQEKRGKGRTASRMASSGTARYGTDVPCGSTATLPRGIQNSPQVFSRQFFALRDFSSAFARWLPSFRRALECSQVATAAGVFWRRVHAQRQRRLASVAQLLFLVAAW
jgi:hypothetical protein